jgi:hypothetical protein
MLVVRHLRADAVHLPRLYQAIGQLPAGLDQKGTGTQRWV